MALEAARILKEHNIRFKWYFVGDGSLMGELKTIIEKYGLRDYVILLGLRENPYPYMKHCDIYVQPSLHEGYCITLAEAKLFGHPIVATDFTGAREQLEPYQGQWEITGHNHQDITLAIEHMIELLHQ